MKQLKNRKGFTLVELIVVIAVLALLAVIAVFAFSGVQSAARRSPAEADEAALVRHLNLCNSLAPTAARITDTTATGALRTAGAPGGNSGWAVSGTEQTFAFNLQGVVPAADGSDLGVSSLTLPTAVVTALFGAGIEDVTVAVSAGGVFSVVVAGGCGATT